MTYLVYNKNDELEDVIELNSTDEVSAYEKSHPESKLEFIEDKGFDDNEFWEEDEEDELDKSDNLESEW